MARVPRCPIRAAAGAWPWPCPCSTTHGPLGQGAFRQAEAAAAATATSYAARRGWDSAGSTAGTRDTCPPVESEVEVEPLGGRARRPWSGAVLSRPSGPGPPPARLLPYSYSPISPVHDADAWWTPAFQFVVVSCHARRSRCGGLHLCVVHSQIKPFVVGKITFMFERNSNRTGHFCPSTDRQRGESGRQRFITRYISRFLVS